MSVLRSIEGKIENLFEGVFGRAFRTHVQPVELARKLAKEMDEHRSVSVSRVYVPNEYVVYLSPPDRSQFAAYEGSLVGELQEYLMEHARREGYALLTPARVVLASDDDLAVGEFGISTRVIEPGVGEVPAAPPQPEAVPSSSLPRPRSFAQPTSPADTVIYRPSEPVASEPAPTEQEIEIVTLTLDGVPRTIEGARAVMGRSRDCELTVPDANVSRRHCEVVRSGGDWFVVDLDSTNGTEHNGQPVKRMRLGNGDRITIGSSDITFTRRTT